MAKQNRIFGNSVEPVEDEVELEGDGVEITAPAYYTKVVHGTVFVRSKFPARIRETGSVSGLQYEWPKAGDVVEVDERDVDFLLTRRVGNKGCCGGATFDNHLFELVT